MYRTYPKTPTINKPPADVTTLGSLDLTGDGTAASLAILQAAEKRGYLPDVTQRNYTWAPKGWVYPSNCQGFDLRYNPRTREIFIGVLADPKQLGLRLEREVHAWGNDDNMDTDYQYIPANPEKGIPKIALIFKDLGLQPHEIRVSGYSEGHVLYEARFPLDKPVRILVESTFEFANTEDAKQFADHMGHFNDFCAKKVRVKICKASENE